MILGKSCLILCVLILTGERGGPGLLPCGLQDGKWGLAWGGRSVPLMLDQASGRLLMKRTLASSVKVSPVFHFTLLLHV